MYQGEKEIEKLYYTIGEISEIFKVKPSLIRFWETEFEALHTKRNRKGFRQFMKKDIETIRTIHHLLKVERYTIQGAKKQLAKMVERKFEVVVAPV